MYVHINTQPTTSHPSNTCLFVCFFKYLLMTTCLPLIFTAALLGRDYFHAHYTEEETEVQRVKETRLRTQFAIT